MAVIILKVDVLVIPESSVRVHNIELAAPACNVGGEDVGSNSNYWILESPVYDIVKAVDQGEKGTYVQEEKKFAQYHLEILLSKCSILLRYSLILYILLKTYLLQGYNS